MFVYEGRHYLTPVIRRLQTFAAPSQLGEDFWEFAAPDCSPSR
jgi:hypothetical protein